jgi:hypothetical protein
MDDTEHENQPDDFTVEITDLDGPAAPARPLGWRLTARQRRFSMIATIGLFVLVMGLLLSSESEVRGLLGQAFEHPTSTPTTSVLSGPLLVYLRGNPTWGHFTVDGKALAHAPVIGYDHPLILAHGPHTIVWQAQPFKPKSCVFTVVDAITVNGPCFLDSSMTSNFEPGVSGMVIAFFASLADLPSDQRASLSQQLQGLFASYDSTEVVQPGELYAVSEQQAQANPALCRPFESLALCYARADQPLIATLSLQVDTLTSSDDPCVVAEQCSSYHQDCRMLCEDPIVNYSQQGIEGWSVVAMLRMLWSYRTTTGQVIASAQPNSALRGSQAYQSVFVHLDRDAQGRWHITPFSTYNPTSSLSNSPACAQATGDTMSALNASFDNNSTLYVYQSASNLARMAQGCLTVASQPEVSVSTTPTPTPPADAIPPASFLLRFGVLLAVNASAHKICPDLPVVDASEKSVAQNLLISFSLSA